MKMTISHVFLLVLMGLMVSCSSTPSNYNNKFFTEKTLNLVQKAVFEVVLEKPTDDLIVYDRELDWENVPFSIRNDKYQPIGTAFAISSNELISAFHVFEASIIKNIFIRDYEGKVYEVDQIKAGCNERDFIVFTVKGKRFDDYFQFENNTVMGLPVFSVGNALGEGIIIRNGFILGTVPEQDSGRWNLLKSSADGSPGNSGGPLITPEGKAVALITSRKDNILYSVPADVILGRNNLFLSYRSKTNYGHLLVPNKINKIFDTRVSLPVTFKEAMNNILEEHFKFYEITMSELFNNAPDYLTGENNAYLFNDSLSFTFPRFSHVDPDDENWKLKFTYSINYDLEEDGLIEHDSIYSSSYSYNYDLYKIKKPRSVSLERINMEPKYIMDLILGNIRTERTLWGWRWDDDSDDYRILSYGEPYRTGQFKDSLGRNWITAHWNIDYDDEVLMMYILPMPNGPVVLTYQQSNLFVNENEMDMQKLCGHTFVTYEGTFSEWTEFLKHNNFIPDFFSDLNFQWDNNEQNLNLNCNYFTLNSDTQTFEWTNDSRLVLTPFWYRNNNNLEFGIRRLIVYKNLRDKDYISFNRRVKPDPKLGSNETEKWNDLMNEKHPYNGKVVISENDNTGSIGSIIKTQLSDTVFSLYLSMENPTTEENILQQFEALKQGLSIRE